MDFLEPLLIWLASCFPFFIPLIVPVGSYGFYKHAAKHTDGTDDIQDATSVQKGLMTAARVSKLDNLITDAIGGDGGFGRNLRIAMLKIDNGTNDQTLKCTLSSVWNGDVIAETDNIAKGATTGDFSLDAGGLCLTIETSGLTGNPLGAFGVVRYNACGVGLTVSMGIAGSDIYMYIKNFTTGVNQDITTLADTPYIHLVLIYITTA